MFCQLKSGGPNKTQHFFVYIAGDCQIWKIRIDKPSHRIKGNTAHKTRRVNMVSGRTILKCLILGIINHIFFFFALLPNCNFDSEQCSVTKNIRNMCFQMFLTHRLTTAGLER